MLRFLVDESTGRGVSDQLRRLGGDVLFVPDVLPQAYDAAILKLAARDQRIVVTNDKDFGELVYRSGQAHAGVVLFGIVSLIINRLISDKGFHSMVCKNVTRFS